MILYLAHFKKNSESYSSVKSKSASLGRSDSLKHGQDPV